MWIRQKSDAQSGFHLAKKHFGQIAVDEFAIQQRVFPWRVRVDLQRAIDEFLADVTVKFACGLQASFHQPTRLSSCLTELPEHEAPRCVPIQYEEVDIGEDEPMVCQENGLWLIETKNQKLAMLIAPYGEFHDITGFRIELAGRNQAEVLQLMPAIFKKMEDSVNRSTSYRGKILSLEQSDHSYTGRKQGIKVHRLHAVDREQVILPESTIKLLDRNILGFVQQRERLRKSGLSTRKGILFYGPPGTGKTHTIHYLTRALPGHTTLIVSAEQVGLLEQYMTLARLLQPSIVVLEDVDLIGRNRVNMNSACEELLLNKLLNHMDGLQESADILFVLTTNRPEMLEPALASRPGRIDQAIEFPLPDDDGRRKLIAMYAGQIELTEDLLEATVRKTQGVSAAFIKELMRRSLQFQLESENNQRMSVSHVDAALDEMLHQGGTLNRVLLGAVNFEE